MSYLLLLSLFGAAVAALVTNLVVPVAEKVAISIGAVDVPGGRRWQRAEVPRMGGLAIIFGLATGAGSVLVLGWPKRLIPLSRAELMAVGLGAFLVFMVGLVDDALEISVVKKLLVEVVAAFLVVHAGWSFTRISLPFSGAVELGVFGELFSIFWIVGVTNAINLLDGLDGLAGGVVAIISSSFLLYAVMQGSLFTVICMAAMVGSCIGFLYHNWEPARIYMGDSGSLTLGFLLAACSVQSSLKAPAAVAILVPILALGVPVIDTLFVMLVRFLEKPRSGFAARCQRMFRADRNHLHFLLLHLGSTRGRIVGSIYAIVTLFCSLSLVLAVTRNPHLGLAFVVVAFLVVAYMRGLGLARKVERDSLRARSQIREEIAGAEADRRIAS